MTLNITAGGLLGGRLGGTVTETVNKGVATFNKVTISIVNTYTVQATDSSLQGTGPTFNVNITKGVSTITTPHASPSYKAGKPINLSAMLKSTAATFVSFTDSAFVVDQNNHTLGTVGVAANGAIKFSLTGVAAGTYTCTVQYPGDANHDAVDSSTFTIHVA